jgi:6-phosphogluconolactonase (cycloisomerase 2 family)
VPPGFTGTDFTSEIRVSADGDFVYGAKHLNDTIGVFKVAKDGMLTQTSNASTLGDDPRIFTIDPSGRVMAVGNQRADNVTTFTINPGNGKLTFTGNYTPMGSPSGMVYLF